MVDPDSVGHELFEKLTAGITSDRDDVCVEHQYNYPLNTGGEKEVDVMVWDTSSGYEEQIMIECKNHGSNLNQGYVDEMVGLLCQSDADRGILIAKTGFQKGAIERAQALQETDGMRVELYVLRFVSHDPNEDERALKKVLMETGYQPHNPENFSFVTSAPDDEFERKLKEGETAVKFTLDAEGSPEIYTNDGKPTGEDLAERWEKAHWENFAEQSDYGVIEGDKIAFSVGIQKEFKSRYTLEFDDVYVKFPQGLLKIEEISYDMALSS